MAKDWIDYKKTSLRATTWEVYQGHVRNHFSAFNDLKINRITTARVEEFITERQLEGMHILTLRKVLVTLGQIFSYAVRHRYMDHNPLRDAERPRDPGETRKDSIILQPEQIQALLENTPSLKYRTLFLLAVTSGARQGELLGLKWSDLDMINGQIYIKGTFNKARFFTTKTRTSNRWIDIGPATLSALKKWKLACPSSELDLMLPNEEGQPINYSNMISRHFRLALRAVAARPMKPGGTVKDLGGGIVGLPCPAYGFRHGETVVMRGTRNYNGERSVLAESSQDQICIEAPYSSGKMKVSALAIEKRNVEAHQALSRIRFHDLRHTFASLLLSQGENVKYIQTQLGHSSPMVTLNVYAHLTEKRNAEAASRLEGAIFGNRSQNGHME